VIEKLLAHGVVGADAVTDVDESLMPPAEAAAVAHAVPKRRREFGTVRHCARQALVELGWPTAPPVSLLPGEHREPGWPDGIVGSLTHCAGYRAAAVARAAEVRSVGIDAEPHGPLPAGVLDSVALPEELHRLAALAAAHPDTHWDRLLFSAKESVYKAWFPLARRWLGFADASLFLYPGGGFDAELLVPGPAVDGAELTGMSGRWLVEAGLVLTAICLPATRPRR
jgi:4'-phosphopantetheinyl transferase EntD